MSFFPDEDNAVLFAALGDDVIYTPYGSPALPAFKAMVEFGSEEIKDIKALSVTLEVLKTDVSAPMRGDKFTFNGRAYTVQQVLKDLGHAYVLGAI